MDIRTEITELRDLIYREMEIRHSANEARHEAQDKALVVAAEVLQHRLEGMNQFRETLTSQANTFITREEIQLLRGSTSAKVEALAKQLQALEVSQSSLQARLYTVSGLLGGAIAITSVLLTLFR